MSHAALARARSSTVVCALAVLAAGCGFSPVDRRQPLQAVSLPDVSAADASVQQQLRERYLSLTAKMQDRGTTDVDLGTAYGEMGKLLMAAEYREAAEPCLLNAEVLVPREIRWPYYLGHLYKIKGDGAKSAASFERALQLRPDDVMTLVSLGDAYLDQARTAEAEQLFTRALSVQADSARALFGLGRAALAKRQDARAVDQLEKALSLDPRAGVIHYPLAMAYRGTGDLTRAEANLHQQGPRQVRVLDPLMDELDSLVESAASYEVRGVRALDEGRWAAAADYFRKSVALAPDDPRLRHKLGTALSMDGDTAGAVRQFEDVARRWPTFAKAQYSLGIMLASAGRYRDAIDRFSAALKSEPSYVEARLQLAEAFRAIGAFEASLAHYKQAAALDPRAAEIQFGCAMALVGLNRYQEAGSLLAEAMNTYPDQPGFAEALARLLAAAPDDRIRDGQRALAIVQGLLRRQQPSVALAETTAMALAETGQYVEAAKWQRKAITAVRQAGRVDLLPYLASRLNLYEHGKPCRAPWGDEIAVLTL
jgi:tetratricopeptide (TPR) repeat protein